MGASFAPTAPLQPLDTNSRLFQAVQDTQRNGQESAQVRRRRLLEEREQMRVNTESIERPSLDRESRRLNQIVTGAGAVFSLLGALGGSEVAARAGEGLASGGAQNLERQAQNFRRRRDRFRERLESAEQFNRELQLSTNEAMVRGAEQAAEREFQEEQQEEEREFQRQQGRRDREFQKTLLKLRNKLDQQLSPKEKKKFEKELDYLDAQIRHEQRAAEADEALRDKRSAEAEAAGDGGGGGGETDGDRPFANLSDKQVERLLERSEFMLRTGFPEQADTNDDDSLSTAEIQQATPPVGDLVPSTSDVDRVSERVNRLRQEARRRGLIGGGNGRTQTPSPNVLQTQPDSSEKAAARDLVEEGVMAPAEFERLYGEQP